MSPPKILQIQDSNRKGKRYIAIVQDEDGDTVRIHFGQEGGSTYIDHRDAEKRRAYWLRHSANPLESRYIDDLILSPATLSAVLLWGPYRTLSENIEFLNDMWNDTRK